MILIPILAIVLALSIDFAFGDPKNKYHPTVWAGKLVSKIVLLARFNSQPLEKLGGVMTVICVLVLISILILSLSFVLQYLNNLELNGISKILVWALTVTVIGLLLKTTIAIKGMEQHASKIMEALSKNDLDDARAKLSMIVKRNTKNLDRQHIISATLESISENIVDGVTGPLFYFAIFSLMLSRVAEMICCLSRFLVFRFTIIDSLALASSRSFFESASIIFDACCSIPFIAIVVFNNRPITVTVNAQTRIFEIPFNSRLLRYCSTKDRENIRIEIKTRTQMTVITPPNFSNG